MKYILLLGALVLAGCGPQVANTKQLQSRARYEWLVQKHGGFDPVSKTLGQRMK